MGVKSKLQLLGLTGSKADFYLAALSLGEASVSEVAKKAGIGRTNSYDILNNLVSDGLLNQIEKSNKTYVIAEDPGKIVRNIEKKTQIANEIQPELQAIFSDSLTKPRIHYYSGIEGIVSVMNDSLKCRSKVLYGILSMEELLTVPGKDFMHEHIKNRIQAGITLKVIRCKKEEVELIWPTSDEELRLLRFSNSVAPFTMTSYIYDDKVAYISSRKENFAMIIQSKEFAGLQMELFNTMWDASTPQ